MMIRIIRIFLAYLSIFLLQAQKILAILPTEAIDVVIGAKSFTLLASTAFFGTHPPMEAESNSPMYATLPPADDPLLCTNYSKSFDIINPPRLIVVPRGNCTFQSKTATAQRLGYSGVIIYGNLASRYSLNSTSNEIIYPNVKDDYDCDKASALIPSSVLSFDPAPYNYAVNDPILSGPESSGNLCAKGNVDFEKMCPSMKCLLTGEERDGQGQTQMEACCAWDFHIWLYSDPNIDPNLIQIPTFYITMSEADTLLNAMSSNPIEALTITMYERWAPKYNLSGLLVWVLGVLVAALASYMSASEYRDGTRKELARHSEVNASETEDVGMGPRSSSKVRNRSISPPKSSDSNNTGVVSQVHENTAFNAHRQESIELTGYHALGFIVFSATGLLVIFFLKIYSFVKVMYAISCCNAMVQVIFIPLFSRIFRKLNIQDRVAFDTHICEIGIVAYSDLLATLTSYGLGTVWIIIAFMERHPSEITFFWVMQDIMGACVCITFLSVIKLNSIRVASLFLIAAFFYDIFFVFVTPYLTQGGRSIMVDVATSGGQPKADPSFCEKYPDDKDCQGGDPLPMLLTVPRIFDYAGSSSLLGLGDIVLPGLLMSFAARFDEAKKFIGARRGGSHNTSIEICSEKKGGYFIPLVVAYAVGLGMANAAVYLMKMGQPALMYLVPTCLGTISFIGWRRGELNEFWNTPKVLKMCDEILDRTDGGTIDRENPNSTSLNANEGAEFEQGVTPLLRNIS